ncbi:hypothetical protein PINS_up023013 [Pythium insidiosum]|nr:hypothetical protein PINS_up023013 [Pythium insidiosum]
MQFEPTRSYLILSFLVRRLLLERLGVPLHCLSATPTARSHAFPHWMTPNVKLSTPYRYTAANGASYDTVDSALWGGLRDILDEFRASVGLLGYTTGRNLLSEWRIPHSFLWNPSILPRPLDWGYEIKIHGYVEVKQEPGPAQAAELISSFVTDSNTAVVYFGFSSGDWDDRRLADLLKEVEKAAVAANVRVVFQTLEDAEGRSLYRSPHVMEVPSSVSLKLILPCAVAAIHWGDISITSTCLSVGIPVCVVPRNQTQRVWGQALALAGVGLEPVELSALSSANLVNIFQDLQHTTLVSTARDLANNSASSDVAADAMVKWFYANLPVDGMTCDLDPSRIARIYDPERQLKLSYEGQRVVQEETGDFALNDFKYKPLKYSISHPPRYSLRQLEQSDPNGDAKVTLKIAFDAPEMATTGMEGIARIGGDRKRGLSRYQSMAANVIETPSTWTSADIRDRRMADINARYEQLLSSPSALRHRRSASPKSRGDIVMHKIMNPHLDRETSALGLTDDAPTDGLSTPESFVKASAFDDDYHSVYVPKYPRGLRGLVVLVQSPLLLMAIGLFSAFVGLFIDFWLVKIAEYHNLLTDWGFRYFLLSALVAASFSAALVHLVCPQATGSGLPFTKVAISGVDMSEYLSLRCIVVKIVGLIAAYAAGLSIGKEGPFIMISSGFANVLMNLSPFKRINNDETKRP